MRIFWLGMHRILVPTELRRLRQLGYEVFNPPYISPIEDQSAERNWDATQKTSLPPDVFEKLSSFDFFYKEIPPTIADILNKYFDAVIVTINTDWLVEILKVYRGRVIYRVFGQPHSVSEHLWHNGGMRLASERPNFWFVPHSLLTAEAEHAWIKARMVAVPYCITDEVVALKDTWRAEGDRPGRRAREIMMTCPNIRNSYYAAHYDFLKYNFDEPHFRYYGVQLETVGDPQVVGTLPRNIQLNAYQRASGYLYTYSEPQVCYLPPIEMMMIGGPVLYLPGSLLARYFSESTPGFCRDPEEARDKARRLLNGEQTFIDEVIASQADVRKLYDPEYVHPKFDATFRTLLSPKTQAPPVPIVTGGVPNNRPQRKRIYVLFHFPGDIIQFFRGQYFSSEGIPRVMRLFVRALLERTDFDVVVTAHKDCAVATFGFFFDERFPDRVRILTTDGTIPRARPLKRWRRFRRAIKRAIRSGFEKFRVSSHEKLASLLASRAAKHSFVNIASFLQKRKSLRRAMMLLLLPFAVVILPLILIKPRRAYQSSMKSLDKRLFQILNRIAGRPRDYQWGRHIKIMATDPMIAGAIVPHYFLFPEATTIGQPVALYLPDYIPHFFPSATDFPNESAHAAIGRDIARVAKVVFTNSKYSKSYLPDTSLQVPTEKIQIFPLPNLNKTPSSITKKTARLETIFKDLDGAPYIFNPTQNRPNKNIKFLFRIFADYRQRRPGIKLLLTCNLRHYEPARREYLERKLKASVVFAPALTDMELRYLYEQSALLCFTSLLEGNFPPQIVEAIEYDTPVVASRLPMITEVLGENTDLLKLVSPNDVSGFIKAVDDAIDRREEVLQRQAQLKPLLHKLRHWDRFAEGVEKVVASMADD